jgi:UDP-2-acetamido-3-amino-2,3-dideoxy-glucuronate N-acetyltransferase
MNYYKHGSSIVDDGAAIGKGCKIWHFTHVMNAQLGEHCVVGQNVFIANHVTIGNRVKIQNNVSVYEGVQLKDDVFIGPSVVFTNVINPRSFIERKDEFKKTIVEQGATIGANATILCGITIGAYSFIGAGSVVTKDILPFALVAGNPARRTGWMSRSGYKLEFDSTGVAECKLTGEKYKLQNEQVSLINNP